MRLLVLRVSLSLCLCLALTRSPLQAVLSPQRLQLGILRFQSSPVREVTPRNAQGQGKTQSGLPPPPEGDANEVNVNELLHHWLQVLSAHFSALQSLSLEGGSDEKATLANLSFVRIKEVLGCDRMASLVLRALLTPPVRRMRVKYYRSGRMFRNGRRYDYAVKESEVSCDIGNSLAETISDEALVQTTTLSHEIYHSIGQALVKEALPILSFRLSSRSVPAFERSYIKRQYGSSTWITRNRIFILRIFTQSGLRPPWLHSAHHLPSRTPTTWTHLSSEKFAGRDKYCVKTLEGSLQFKNLLEDDKRGKMHGLFDGLNALGHTAWIINDRILEVASQVRRKIDDASTTHNQNESADNWKLFALSSEKVKASWQSKYNNHVHNFLRHLEFDREAICFKQIAARQALQMAKELCIKEYNTNSNFRNTEQEMMDLVKGKNQAPFYFTYVADFRGRAYANTPYLNPTGSEFARSLLQFRNSRRLGRGGLFWLKIQLANAFGWGKLSLEERINRVDENMDNIRESASDPLARMTTTNGTVVISGWWQKAQSPWLCLAACFDLAQAMRHAEKWGTVEDYHSHLPIMVDGTCNGLQHYSALSRDSTGSGSNEKSNI